MAESKYEAALLYELCPHCDFEIEVKWCVGSDGHSLYCPYCGNKIMLCTFCPSVYKEFGCTTGGDRYCEFDNDDRKSRE